MYLFLALEYYFFIDTFILLENFLPLEENLFSIS